MALAGLGCVWWPSKESGPLIFSFINFEVNDFRAFGFDFWKAPKSWVLKLETFPLGWEVLIYNRIDMFKKTARNICLTRDIVEQSYISQPLTNLHLQSDTSPISDTQFQRVWHLTQGQLYPRIRCHKFSGVQRICFSIHVASFLETYTGASYLLFKIHVEITMYAVHYM